MQARRKDWAFRLSQHLKKALTAHFITLTYETEHLPVRKDEFGRFSYATLSREHLKQFHKDIRNANSNLLRSLKTKYKLSAKGYAQLKKDYTLKYYSVGEYGTKRNRPHYHCILFNLHENLVNRLQWTGEKPIWKYGAVHLGDVNLKTIQYCAKYLIDSNKTPDDPRIKPFAIISKGIGANYIRNRNWHKAKTDHEDEHRYYVMLDGHKQRLPRYYKDKIFNEFERKRHGQKALQELKDKEEKDIAELANIYGSLELAVMKYNERLQAEHDSIRIKSKLKDTL